MTADIRNLTVDCQDAPTLARFWAEVLGWIVFTDDDPEVLVAPAFPPPPGTQTMLFIPVPEAKTAKNRMHLDLVPATVRGTKKSSGWSVSAPASSRTIATPTGRAGCGSPTPRATSSASSAARRSAAPRRSSNGGWPGRRLTCPLRQFRAAVWRMS